MSLEKSGYFDEMYEHLLKSLHAVATVKEVKMFLRMRNEPPLITRGEVGSSFLMREKERERERDMAAVPLLSRFFTGYKCKCGSTAH